MNIVLQHVLFCSFACTGDYTYVYCVVIIYIRLLYSTQLNETLCKLCLYEEYCVFHRGYFTEIVVTKNTITSTFSYDERLDVKILTS